MSIDVNARGDMVFTASQVFGLQAVATALGHTPTSIGKLKPMETKDLPIMSRAAMRTFDSDAQQLVRDFQTAGWRGYMTGRGHAMMLAPDGVTSASVTRDSLRGRSGRNARAKLNAWLREHPTPGSESPKTGSAFGNLESVETQEVFTVGDDGEYRPVKTALLASLRRNEVLTAWMDANAGWDHERLEIVGDEANPHAWGAFDNATKPPTLVTTGRDFTEDDAWGALHHQHPDMYKPKEEEPVATITEYVCDVEGCEKTSNTPAGLALHTMQVHGPEKVCPVKGCGRAFKGPAAYGRHIKTHEVKIVAQTPAQKGASNGEAVPPVAPVEKKAPGKVRPPEVGNLNPEMKAAARRMAELPAGTTYDVLTDHLEHLPEGHDAEDMVARIRAIVAAPLVHEIRTLRAENARLTGDLADVTSKLGEVETRLSIMREALSV